MNFHYVVFIHHYTWLVFDFKKCTILKVIIILVSPAEMSALVHFTILLPILCTDSLYLRYMSKIQTFAMLFQNLFYYHPLNNTSMKTICIRYITF